MLNAGLSVLVLSDGLCVISIFLPQSQFMKPEQASPDEDSLSAVYLLIAGITAARFGVYMFDLCIVQLFQEAVTETKRGIFSGVEAFLCNSMDMIKFALVIILPSPQLHFGYLVIATFTSVFLGWCIFVVFIRREHLIRRVCSRVEKEDGVEEELETLGKLLDEIDKKDSNQIKA